MICAEQLPTGSCVLKPQGLLDCEVDVGQLPTGSCVLKLSYKSIYRLVVAQLPTGSCVLKQKFLKKSIECLKAATYG